MTSEKATYKSPIEIFINDVNYSMEQTVLAAVSNVGINVDKDELVKALEYDRQQYEEGYRNAMKQMPKWIPVTEWLPGEKVEVLVTVEVDGKKYVESGMLSSINHGQWETIYDRYVIDVYGRSRNSKVIAWMPLPDCYEEAEE